MTKPSKESMDRAHEIVYGKPRWTDDATLVERIAKALDNAMEDLSERCCELHVMNNLWQEGRARSAKLVEALEFYEARDEVAEVEVSPAKRALAEYKSSLKETEL